MRHRVSESGRPRRLLGERLLTVEWQHRELPEAEHRPRPGNWLLISTADG